MKIKDFLHDVQNKINQHIEKVFNNILSSTPEDLKKAMHYSLFAGGKRLRPILVYAVCDCLKGSLEDAKTVGVAIEFIHTYSLIHDDLPAMDDDDYRRGKLTNHKVFGEGMAILAGDALLTEAFNILSNKKLLLKMDNEAIIDICNFISKAAGASGMVGGQVLDLKFENKKIDEETLREIHLKKTAKLITASIYSGARIATKDKSILEDFTIFGEKLGLAFQIIDDVLDVIGDSKILGKQVGSDERKGKATYPIIIGINESKSLAQKLTNDAKEIIKKYDTKQILTLLSEYMLKRIN